ncbi:MAG: hypothetical protein LC808_31585, partial [Actinobacteria bacterium]|nr:hypothetical protein [Actinomycetota bacterium]
MHLVRSFASQELWKRAIEQVRPLDDESREHLTSAFEQEMGRRPQPGEIDDWFGGHLDTDLSRNEDFVKQMGVTYRVPRRRPKVCNNRDYVKAQEARSELSGGTGHPVAGRQTARS